MFPTSWPESVDTGPTTGDPDEQEWLEAGPPRWSAAQRRRSRVHYLVRDCDQRHACHSYRIDKGSGDRVPLEARYDTAGGLLSPDGRYVALTAWQHNDRVSDTVHDVLAGKVALRHTRTYDDSSFESRFSRLPDGRLIGLRDGRLFLFEPRTGKFSKLDN